jgi:DNA-binding NtrC family response regulator
MSDRRKTLLIVDHDDEMREALTGFLRRDLRVLRAGTGEGGLQMMEKEDVDLMVLDAHLPGISGFEVLKIAKENYPYVEVIVISKVKELEIAIEAMRLGAYHYTSKDIDLEALRTDVTNASERQDLRRDVMRLREEVAETSDREFVVGPSQGTRAIVEMVQKVAGLPANVLVLGETGTGKELLARLIHREAGRVNAPFVAVNLAAIPKELVESTLFGHEKGAFTGAIRQQLGKFELASGGTLFLDEVGDLRYELQAKLLRAIQEGEIERVGGMHPIKTDLRLIAATNIDLEKAVKEGRFREDLYYRLNVIPIRMPALRDRIDDLPDLARFFLRRYNVKFRKNIQGIADSTMQILTAYWWPGNIRELENLIERLVAVSDKDWITDEDLPYELHVAQLDAQGPTTENCWNARSRPSNATSSSALEKSGWNVTGTAARSASHSAR